MLEEATQLINMEIGTTSNVTSSGYTTYLRNLCYRMVELMIDEEQARQGEAGRSVMIPRDYMYERDRMKLRRIGREMGYRKFGGTTSG